MAKAKPAKKRPRSGPAKRKRAVKAVRPKPVAAAPRPKPARQLPAGEPVVQPSGQAFPIEFDTTEIEATLAKVASELKHWANKGRYTKVRFKFRGKQLLPDLPLAAVVAAEGLTFYWGGILRALIVNLAGKAALQVELVNDSEKKIQQGKEALLSGETEKALALFEEALDMDRDNASAHLNIGVVSKLHGDLRRAQTSFERARAKDPSGPIGAEAERLLQKLPRRVDTEEETVSSPGGSAVS